MRLLLDADLSVKRIGPLLTRQGHDVRGIASEPDLEGLDDEAVLELATADKRIVVTRNARDFGPLCRMWAEAVREHAGVIVIWSLSHHEFAAIAKAVGQWLTDVPKASDWTGLTVGV